MCCPPGRLRPNTHTTLPSKDPDQHAAQYPDQPAVRFSALELQTLQSCIRAWRLWWGRMRFQWCDLVSTKATASYAACRQPPPGRAWGRYIPRIWPPSTRTSGSLRVNWVRPACRWAKAGGSPGLPAAKGHKRESYQLVLIHAGSRQLHWPACLPACYTRKDNDKVEPPVLAGLLFCCRAADAAGRNAAFTPSWEGGLPACRPLNPKL